MSLLKRGQEEHVQKVLEWESNSAIKERDVWPSVIRSNLYCLKDCSGCHLGDELKGYGWK